MLFHMSSAPPSEGATCSVWPFEKPWGLHVCPTPCPQRPPPFMGATCSSWPCRKPWGRLRLLHDRGAPSGATCSAWPLRSHADTASSMSSCLLPREGSSSLCARALGTHPQFSQPTLGAIGSPQTSGRGTRERKPLGGTTAVRPRRTGARTNPLGVHQTSRPPERGWKWSSCPHFTELAQPMHVHDESADHITPLSSRCKEALSASNSDTTSSEGPGDASSTGGS